METRSRLLGVQPVFRMEWREAPRRLGGARGASMLVVVALLGMIPAFKLRYSLLDPIYLLAYTIFAAMFAGSWAAQSWAGERERAWIENRGDSGASDSAVASGKIAAGTLFGWLCWLLIFGAALGAVNAVAPGLALPSGITLLSLAVFALALAWLASAIGAWIGMSVFTARAAQQLLRLGLVFILLVALAGPRLLPPAWQHSLARLLVGSAFRQTLLIACPVLFLVGLFFRRLAVELLTERRVGLHITG
jgi:hypothetical protein